MGSEGITHFEWLQAEKARVRSLLSKKASPAALARLPKPIVPKREALPPVVLAKAANAAINSRRQDASRQVVRARVLGTFATPEQEKAIMASPFYRIQAAGDGAAHLKELAAVAGAALGLTPWDLAKQRSSERFTYGRYIVTLILTDLCMVSSERISETLGVTLESAKSSRRRGRALVARSQVYTEKYGVALQAVCARWPEYRSAA